MKAVDRRTHWAERFDGEITMTASKLRGIVGAWISGEKIALPHPAINIFAVEELLVDTTGVAPEVVDDLAECCRKLDYHVTVGRIGNLYLRVTDVAEEEPSQSEDSTIDYTSLINGVQNSVADLADITYGVLIISSFALALTAVVIIKMELRGPN